MLVGGWHHRLPPLPGELLTSCLARNALAHGTSPTRFLSLFWPREQPWSVDLDRDLAGLAPRDGQQDGRGWPDRLAEAMGVPRDTVLGATLDAYRIRLTGGTSNARGATPLLLSAGLAARRRRRHALQFCPDCLGEGVPHFRREWRLAFVVACLRHGRPLQDACPWCDAVVAPHRTMGACITDCHDCGRPLTGRSARRTPIAVSATVAALQGVLMGHLTGTGRMPVGPWTDRAAFDGVRCLIGIAAGRRLHPMLREGLGLPPAALPAGVRLYIEVLRADARGALLETAAAWLADWPAGFRAGAEAAGLTRRTFARTHVPGALAAEVARMPDGNRRDNAWKPVLEEPVLKRLRRRDPAKYRAVRAERIVEVVGKAQHWDPRSYPEHAPKGAVARAVRRHPPEHVARGAGGEDG